MRPPELRVYFGADEIIVDNFAGGGGASSGIELALGRSPDMVGNSVSRHPAAALVRAQFERA